MHPSILSSRHSSISLGVHTQSILIAGIQSRLIGSFSSSFTSHHPRGIGLRPLTVVRPQYRGAVVLFALAAELKSLRQVESRPSSESLVWRQAIEEDYEIGKLLGEGQQGIVKEATCKKTGQKFAVKIMSKSQAKFATSVVKRMKAEAAFLADTQSCPFSVQLIGAYEDRENIYIIMDCLSGGSLAETLERLGSLPEQLAAQFMFHVVSFLLHIHSQGLCYGDIKPANFMLSAPVGGPFTGISSILKAVDFGCCQKVVPGLRFRAKTGTPLYMAPEVHIGNYGIESDVWSAAVMMFQMLSGKLPFVKCDRRGVVRDMGAHVGYSFDGEEWVDISPEARDLLEQLLVKDKSKRLNAGQILQHPWFAKFRNPVSSNIISLNKEKTEANQTQLKS
eukprot:g6005.t1